ncbi:arginase family protein [Sphingomonas nostoxanthinifaciens]|uniref:arginase family protein n=1 Tax=Sphingomonas nostoxanthinifaciens TaxID=2872652 RepID=UPI001CC21C61|nr:arginase family protein [Sphingomonas nostoxanthinifaciens]UAK23956.1 arginase family protein [Sphingomonas nostoxanthinifaciens]
MPAPKTFIGLPAATLDRLEHPRIVVLGASEASPYTVGERSHSGDAPAALRKASAQFGASLGQYDFDLDATMFPNKDDKRGCVDAGDVPTNSWDAAGNRARITATVRAVLDAGAVPILLGGDDSVPIPALAAFQGRPPLTILQIDAHVDWADVLQGNPVGYGSTMRRVAEYPWVAHMVQVGIRGLGSGEAWQHDDARAWGSHLISSYALHEQGCAAALDHIAPGADVFISIDCDGIDPAVLPAVNMPTPGGLSYEDMIRLLKGVAAKARIAGLALVEYVPSRDDRHMMSGLVAARIAAVTMGLVLGSD